MNRKMGISQIYNLGHACYQNYFIFDLVRREVKLISQTHFKDLKDNLSSENKNIAKSFLIPEEYTYFKLSSEQCEQLNIEYEKIERVWDEDIPGIWSLTNIFINKEYVSDEINWSNYQYVNRFPKSWIGFGEFLIDILGFDLLNINKKDLITELNYDICYDGVYDKKTRNKLNLEKINFSIPNSKNLIDLSISSDDSNFTEICEKLDFYGVYRWYHKDSCGNIVQQDDFNDFDGNSWFLELIFEDGKVLNLRGDNAYPDTYIHLGKEISNLFGDYLMIEDIKNSEELSSYGLEKFANKRNEIKKIVISQKIGIDEGLYNKFTIDCENLKIIPDTDYNIRYNEDINSQIFKQSLKNVPKEEFKLDQSKFNDFIMEFKKLNLRQNNYSPYELRHVYRNTLEISYPIGEFSYDFKNDPKSWIKLGELLENLVGYDILNLELSKEVITNLYYDIKRDGVYDRQTGQKLKLKSLYYGNGAVLSWGYKSHEISIDFENKRMSGCINEDNVSEKVLNHILELLEKYHLYELDDEAYWQKLIYHKRAVFDGYAWSFELIFEGDKYWVIGTSNEFPDIYYHLANEIIDLTGVDILNLETVLKEDFYLYKKYGDKILNEG